MFVISMQHGTEQCFCLCFVVIYFYYVHFIYDDSDNKINLCDKFLALHIRGVDRSKYMPVRASIFSWVCERLRDPATQEIPG